MAITKGQILSAANLNAAYVSLSSMDNDMLGNLSSRSGTFFANRVHAATDLIADLNLSVKGKAVFTKTAGIAEIIGESISGGSRLKLNANEVYLSGTNVTMQSSGHLVMNATSGGNVGIGVSTPGSKLHVGGELRVSGDEIFRIIPHDNGFDVSSSGALAPHYGTSLTIFKGSPGSGTHAFYLDSSLNATLYGKASINKQVWIKGGPTGTSDTINGLSLNNSWLRIGDTLGLDSNEIYFSTTGHIGTTNNSSIQFRTNNVTRMILTGDGKIGIGPSTPAYTFDVSGSGRVTGDFKVDNQIIGAIGDGNGIKIGNVQISSVTNEDLIINNAEGIRFSASPSWDFNEWAGLKYDQSAHIIYLGGPAGEVFQSNSSPPTVHIDLKQGVDDVRVPNLEANTIHVLPASTYSATYTKASVFAVTSSIRRGIIRFSAASGSNDPGAIYHETSTLADDLNKGVIHICPSDDSDNSVDYVTIHGTNDAETIKLFTGGLIQTTNQFKSTIASGTAPFVVSSNTVVANLNADLLDGRQGSAYAHSNMLQNDTDLNTVTQSGFYRLQGSHSNSPSHGLGYGQLIVSRGGSSTISQIAMSYNADNMSFRSGNPSDVGGPGSWRPWRRLWHSGDSIIRATLFSGNASTASKWANSRTITLSGDASGSVSFDGSTNVSLNVTVANDSHLHDARYLKKTGDTFTGLLDIERIGKDNNGVYVPYPRGGEYETHSSTITGAIKITLPQSWVGTMMQFAIDIYSYRSSAKSTYFVGGYNSTASSWVNTSAYSIGYNNAGSKSGLTVRFGHDGTKCCVLIGETNTTWNYPQIIVRNFYGGYHGTSLSQWETNWDISFVTTLPTITSTITNTLTKSSYALDSDKVDGLNASSFFRADAANSVDVRFSTSSGRGVRFWDSDGYKIYMSSSTDSSWGGRGPGETASDYNMYFKMSNGASRGWVFKNNTTSVASIDGYGNGYFKELKSNSNRVLTTANISTSVSSTSTTTAASSSAVKAAYDRASSALSGSFVNLNGTSTMTGGLKVNAGVGNSGITFGGTNSIYRFTDQGGLVINCDSSMVLFAGDVPSKLTTGLGYSAATSSENIIMGADNYVRIISNLQSGYSSGKQFTFGIDGNMSVPSGVVLSGDVTLSKDSDTLLIDTPHGYANIGPMNSHHCHYYTDRASNYFNKSIITTGELYAGVSNLVYHQGNLAPFKRDTDNWFGVSSYIKYLFHLSHKSGGTLVISPGSSAGSESTSWVNEFNFYSNGNFDAMKLSSRGEGSLFYHKPGSWIAGATEAALTFNQQASDASYYSTLAVTTAAGHKVSLGGIYDCFGFTVYDKDRTANGNDGRFYINASNKRVYCEMKFNVSNTVAANLFEISGTNAKFGRYNGDSTYISNSGGSMLRLFDNNASGITWSGRTVATVTTSTGTPSGTAYKGQIWIQY